MSNLHRKPFVSPYSLSVLMLVLGVLFFSACASKDKLVNDKPHWIDGNSEKYGKAMYLTGQGMGDSARDAKDRARSDLAKQFEVAVMEQSQQSQRFQSSSENGIGQQSLEQRISRQLITSTSRTLEGVEIVEQWLDKGASMHYALAILSRPRAQQQFEQKIGMLDDQAQHNIRQAGRETSTLRKAALLQRAINAQQQRVVVQSSLQVVDSSGRGKPPQISLAELIRTRDAFLAKVTIAPQVKSEPDGGVGGDNSLKLLSAAIAEAGFALADQSNASYKLLLQLDLDPMLAEKGWYWSRGTVQLTLLASDDKELGVQRWPLKVSATTKERAEQRMLTEMGHILKKQLRSSVLGFAMH